MTDNPRVQGISVQKCPACGREVRANMGWARMFYDGYCNYCDQPVVNGMHVNIRRTHKTGQPEE